MLLEVLGIANTGRVLGAIQHLGGKARYTDIRNQANLGDTQVSRALKELNKHGLVVGRPGEDRSMTYALTTTGQEAIAVLGDFHAAIHARKGPVAEATDRELEQMLVA